jgi:hypothetical protein
MPQPLFGPGPTDVWLFKGYMRILRGLSGGFLPCGCLTGIYETYEGEIVSIVDARGTICADSAHACGNLVPMEPPARPVAEASPPADSISDPPPSRSSSRSGR